MRTPGRNGHRGDPRRVEEQGETLDKEESCEQSGKKDRLIIA